MIYVVVIAAGAAAAGAASTAAAAAVVVVVVVHLVVVVMLGGKMNITFFFFGKCATQLFQLCSLLHLIARSSQATATVKFNKLRNCALYNTGLDLEINAVISETLLDINLYRRSTGYKEN